MGTVKLPGLIRGAWRFYANGFMTQATVGMVMGSDSDMPVMRKAASILDDFGVPYELEILSAHRTPELVLQYAETAEDRGLQVIIAGAGLAAALPGAIASKTTLPVIGVPIASGPLEGFDALLAIVQVPISVPVATVGIGNGRNAALFAVQVLARSDDQLAERLRQYKRDQFEAVIEKRKVNGINGKYIDGLLKEASFTA